MHLQKEADLAKARGYRDEAKGYDRERKHIQQRLLRAVEHPCTEYTWECSGADVGESPLHYPRAVCTALKWLKMDEQTAHRLLNVGVQGKGKMRTGTHCGVD